MIVTKLVLTAKIIWLHNVSLSATLAFI